MTKKTGFQIGSMVVVALVAVLGLGAIHAQADTAPASWQGHPTMQGGPGMMHRPMTGHMGSMSMGVAGTVTALNGNLITVSSKRATTTTAYTIDATNAVVIKNNATSSVSAILSGDMIFAQGTVSGTSVTATRIFDGKPMMPAGKGMGGWANSTSTMRMHASTTAMHGGWHNGTSTPGMNKPGNVLQRIGNFFKGLFHR